MSSVSRNADRSPTDPPSQQRRRLRAPLNSWRWYYFYFVLAGIDVAVIVASVFVHHMTLASFDAALADVTAAHQDQHWLSEVASTVIALNAPGNDIFESRDLDAAVRAFDEELQRWHRLVSRRSPDVVTLDAVIPHVERMVEHEQHIFADFRSLPRDSTDPEQEQRLLADATATMALMDRAQAHALAELNEASRELRRVQHTSLDQHHQALARRTRLEYVFVLVVALILMGVFWYGRKLQQTDERLVTERRRVEQERQLRLASVGEVCFHCAHGIRNPLASIASSAQLVLEYGTVDANSRRRAEDILASCDLLNRRIGRLLGHARVHALEPAGQRLGPVLEEAVNTVMSRAKASGLTVAIESTASSLTAEVDRALLVQAIGELLGNAIDHTPVGGHITLRCRMIGAEMLEIGVADDGPGIPDESKGRIFDLFFTSKPDGHGIGLASVQRTADRHGGSVFVENEAPHGACVGLRIPVRQRRSVPG